MSDELVIERIRSAMRDEVDGMAPRPETLERVLASPPGRGFGLGWVAPALAVGVAVVVAIVAVTSLSHRPAGSGRAQSGVPRGTEGFVRELAVLRRPQSAADRLPGWAVRKVDLQLGGGRLVPGLTRLVDSEQLGSFRRARVYLIIDAAPRRELRALRAAERDDYVAGIAVVERTRVAPRLPTVSLGGLVARTPKGVGDVADLTRISGVEAAVVPDGVSRVKWVFTPIGTDSGLRPITVWPQVRGNLAIGSVSPSLQVYLSSAAWYGAGGRVLQSFSAVAGPSARARKFSRALEASVHDPVARVLLRHFGVLRTTSGQLHAPGLDHAAIAALTEANLVDLNVAQTRFVAYPPTSAKLLVVPGTQGMALRSVSPMVGQASGGTPAALSGQLVIESARSGARRMVVGLAPDGNRSVTVLLPGGGVRTARVIDNVYSVIVPAGARTVVVVVRNAAGHRVRIRV